MPSATKKVAPTIKRVAVSSMTTPPLSTASPKKNRAIANRPRITARVKVDTKTIPSSVATKPARLTAAASLRPTACPTRRGARHTDAERHHEQDGGNLQSDLMGRQRGSADQAHQKRRGGEQAILHQEGD